MEQVLTHKSSLKRLFLALLFGVLYFLVLIYGSQASGSLSLAASAGHMLLHNGVLLVAILASFLAKLPFSSFHFKYGYIENIGALFNGLLLVIIGLFIASQGLDVHHEHHNVNSEVMSIASLIGLFLQLFAVLALQKGRKQSLNVYAAYMHIFFDLLMTLATLAVSVLMYLGFAEVLDIYLGVVIAIVMVITGLRIMSQFVNVMRFTLHAPSEKDVLSVLKSIEHVQNVHNLAIQMTKKGCAISAHIVLNSDCIHEHHHQKCEQEAAKKLKEKFNLTNILLQIEVADEHGRCCNHPSHA